MGIRSIIHSLIILSVVTICSSEVVEINSSVPYSCGVVEIGEGVHFSTGLSLRHYNTGHSVMTGSNHMVCPVDSQMYTSYALNPDWGGDSEAQDFQGILEDISTGSKWEQVTMVDTSVQLLDSFYWKDDSTHNGHFIYNYLIGEPGAGDWFQVSYGLNDVIISQDSSENYIKWQIFEIKSSSHIEAEGTENEHVYYTIDGVFLKWEIDSCGNGEFLCSPVSNQHIVSYSAKHSNSTYVQKGGKLLFPEYQNLSISLYKSNGQLLKMNSGIGNSIDISDISEGFYVAQIKVGHMVRTLLVTKE